VAQAGEHFVAGELHGRGAYAVTLAGNRRDFDLMASDRSQTRTVYIQVKAKSGRSPGWQTRTTHGRARESDPSKTRFWVFVDLKQPGEAPAYYVVPESWIQNNIHAAHQAYLSSHGGMRPQTLDSTHHKIELQRIEQWRDRWDILGVFPELDFVNEKAQAGG
jgi:hypothetical protein